jgi:putative tryptophan/tyrosine transport system substrate-binding protein
MRRREFISLLGGTVAWSLAARAQQPTKAYRIAVVGTAPIAEMSETANNPGWAAFFNELRRLGYVEGSNLIVDRYSGEGREERYAELCREVVRTNPNLIVTVTSQLVLGLKAATNTIPIVGQMGDPVAVGIVDSIARPGGNITGISVEAGRDIWGKRLQLLREAVPAASKVGFLASRNGWKLLTETYAFREAAQQLNMSLVGPPIESPMQEGEYRRVFEAMAKQHVDGVIVSSQGENVVHRRLIADLASNARLPAVFPYSDDSEIGALIAYGSSLADLSRRLAHYVDQVLKGAPPGELPIYLASRFDLKINLTTAKALGISFPSSLIVRADEVIE